MHATPTETTLLRFCELLKRWREGRRPDELSTALAAVEAAAHRGERDTVDVMCRAFGAVTGVRAMVAEPEVWAATSLN